MYRSKADLEEKHCVLFVRQEEEECDGMRAVGMGTVRKAKIVYIPPKMEVEFGLGFPSVSLSYYS